MCLQDLKIGLTTATGQKTELIGPTSGQLLAGNVNRRFLKFSVGFGGRVSISNSGDAVDGQGIVLDKWNRSVTLDAAEVGQIVQGRWNAIAVIDEVDRIKTNFSATDSQTAGIATASIAGVAGAIVNVEHVDGSFSLVPGADARLELRDVAAVVAQWEMVLGDKGFDFTRPYRMTVAQAANLVLSAGGAGSVGSVNISGYTEVIPTVIPLTIFEGANENAVKATDGIDL